MLIWERALQWEAVWSDKRGGGCGTTTTLFFCKRGQCCISAFQRKQQHFQWGIQRRAVHRKDISAQTATASKKISILHTQRHKGLRLKVICRPLCCWINKMKATQHIERGSLLNIHMLCVLHLKWIHPLSAQGTACSWLYYFFFAASPFLKICSWFTMVTDHLCFFVQRAWASGFDMWMAN